MAVKTFAAIDIGSYELSMKIFEVSKKNGMRQCLTIFLVNIKEFDYTISHLEI